MTDRSELSMLLQECWGELESQKRDRILDFYDLVCLENQVQNLTRLTSPEQFYEGHLVDVKTLLGSGFLNYPAIDLGSGGGVPGVPCAIIDEKPWILIESESRKAEFLSKTIERLRLLGAQVINERAERCLPCTQADTVVSRAVGPLEKIFGWIQKCSTWNTLILLKGPAWEEEWERFEKLKPRKLKIAGVVNYEIGQEKRKRVIVKLNRRS